MVRRVWMLVALVAVFFSAAAHADDRADILASCAVNIGLSAAGCNCIADKAMSEFSEAEFAFFMAVIRDDRDAQTAAAQGMTPDEMTSIGERMNDMPAECAG